MPSPERSEAARSRRPIDAVALQRVLQRLNRAAQPPWLHAEAARRMGERLQIIRLQPERIVDWHAFLGASGSVLAQAYPRAQVLAVESGAERRDATAVATAPRWWLPRRWARAAGAAVTDDVVPEAAAQLVWSNMGLHGAADPQAVMQQWQRALAQGGFLMFSTLGPGSLTGLQTLYAQAGWPAPFAPFVDMHDLGDMLVAAGFADPVMDQEQLTLTWSSADALVAELRQLGGNASLRRCSGLRTPRWRQRLADALAARADADGRIALQFELVYGHAFKAPPRVPLAAETVLPLADMRTLLRTRRNGG